MTACPCTVHHQPQWLQWGKLGCLDDARGVWDAELSLAAAGSYKELQWQIQSDQLRDSPDRAGNNSFAACLIQKKSNEKNTCTFWTDFGKMKERRNTQPLVVRCKLVLVGDVQCGKTAMLQVLAKDCYPEVCALISDRKCCLIHDNFSSGISFGMFIPHISIKDIRERSHSAVTSACACSVFFILWLGTRLHKPFHGTVCNDVKKMYIMSFFNVSLQEVDVSLILLQLRWFRRLM